jgi:hypothetical protein
LKQQENALVVLLDVFSDLGGKERLVPFPAPETLPLQTAPYVYSKSGNYTSVVVELNLMDCSSMPS